MPADSKSAHTGPRSNGAELGVGVIAKRFPHLGLRIRFALRQHTRQPFQAVFGVPPDSRLQSLEGRSSRDGWLYEKAGDEALPAAVARRLREMGCQTIILLEDDCQPVRDGWEDNWPYALEEAPVVWYWPISHDAEALRLYWKHPLMWMDRTSPHAVALRAECLPEEPITDWDAFLRNLAERGPQPPEGFGYPCLIGDDAGLTDHLPAPTEPGGSTVIQTDPDSRIGKALDASEWPHGFCDEAERRFLAENALGARWVIEIGTLQGRSATALTYAHDGVTICVDRWRRPVHWHKFVVYCGHLLERGRIIPIREDSHVAIDTVREALDGALADLIWLDGGHDEPVIRGDIELYLPLLRPGGLLCGHDFGYPDCPGVERAVRELLPGFYRGPGTIWAWRKPE